MWVLVLIGISIALSLFFFFLTLYKKLGHLSEDKRKKVYQEQIENVLFRYLFEGLSLQEVLQDKALKKMFAIPLFQRVAIKAIISLHHSYSGTYGKKLEQFYVESGLVNYSLKKLESCNWTNIVEAVRDLSTLNHNQSYPRIAAHIIHKNPLVKTEVLLGIIKMKGISEILKFQESGLYLNDWVQSNILFTVKKYKIPAPGDLGNLLKSRNRSIVLLAVRLIAYYESSEFYTRLSEFYLQTKDEKLKNEIARVLNRAEPAY
ncbi:hypothetical protein GCM10010465_00900 [Actinomadura fibrosa]